MASPEVAVLDNRRTASKPVIVTSAYHHDVLITGLWNFFARQHGTDYELREGESVRVHRLVLEVFLVPDKMLSLKAAAGSDLDVLLIEFLYNGTVSVPEESLDRMLEMARELDFAMLVDAIESVRMDAPAMDELKAESRTEGASLRRQRKGKPIKLRMNHSVVPKNNSAKPGDPQKSAVGTRARRRPSSVLEMDSIADDDGIVKRKRQRKSRETMVKVEPEASTEEDESKPTVRRRPLISCDHCMYQTRSRVNLKLHLATNHDPNNSIFRCAACRDPFPSQDALVEHKCVAGEDAGPTGRLHECFRCSFTASDYDRWKVHVTGHGLAVFQCKDCSTAYLSQASLDRHKTAAHLGSPVVQQCPNCDFNSAKSNLYLAHLKVMHGVNAAGLPVEKKCKCPHCEESFVYNSILERHVMIKHTFARPFKCQHCAYASSRQSSLRQHETLKHSPNAPSFVCDTCGLSTVTHANLVKHRRIHLEVRNRPYTPRRKLDTSKFMKVEPVGMKPYYPCNICPFRGNTPYEIERHLVSHSGERPFQCDTCGRCFGDSNTLKRHAQLHENYAKPFVCQVCAHAFNRRHNLRTHLRNVHKTVMDPDAYK